MTTRDRGVHEEPDSSSLRGRQGHSMCAGNPGGPWSPPNELEPISAVAIPQHNDPPRQLLRCIPRAHPRGRGPLESEGCPTDRRVPLPLRESAAGCLRPGPGRGGADRARCRRTGDAEALVGERGRSPGRRPVGHSRLAPPARPVRVSGSSTWGACAAAPPPRGSPCGRPLTWRRHTAHRNPPGWWRENLTDRDLDPAWSARSGVHQEGRGVHSMIRSSQGARR